TPGRMVPVLGREACTDLEPRPDRGMDQVQTVAGQLGVGHGEFRAAHAYPDETSVFDAAPVDLVDDKTGGLEHQGCGSHGVGHLVVEAVGEEPPGEGEPISPRVRA